jgi:hypothetical protein
MGVGGFDLASTLSSHRDDGIYDHGRDGTPLCDHLSNAIQLAIVYLRHLDIPSMNGSPVTIVNEHQEDEARVATDSRRAMKAHPKGAPMAELGCRLPSRRPTEWQGTCNAVSVSFNVRGRTTA